MLYSRMLFGRRHHFPRRTRLTPALSAFTPAVALCVSQNSRPGAPLGRAKGYQQDELLRVHKGHQNRHRPLTPSSLTAQTLDVQPRNGGPLSNSRRICTYIPVMRKLSRINTCEKIGGGGRRKTLSRRERSAHKSHGNQELLCGQKGDQELRGVNKGGEAS